MAEVMTKLPPWNTGTLRYDFHVACVRKHPGRVLNVGCNEDPSQLRVTFGNRVVNCDRSGWDEHMNRPNAVDRIFDALEFPWPFEDDSAELVVLGDILEHFPAERSIEVLREARRIADYVCVTVPEDTRIDEAQAHKEWDAAAYNLHTTVVTRNVLESILAASGWEADWIVSGLWGRGGDWGEDGINGWCAHAHRSDTPAFATGGPVPGSAENPLVAAARWTAA